ncbi:DUF6878 family protein [Rubrimonas cliftonensis]|uniref:DUF6878 domain-containing protein n=1 Tax=Rubrimonas cliftonensis TaxID=89524 RepID=A0A1H4ERD6_9RHOB|nr:DUF6878 family protein [Rubrimonas cliftonensis]SEA87477.1 hypothetical protein SAMN05444370_11552 [Rubrimonas cliftonensis]
MTDAMDRHTDQLAADWAAQAREAKAREEAEMTTLRAALLAAARAAEATSIEADYAGGGDSGAFESLVAQPVAAQDVLGRVVVKTTGQLWNPDEARYVEIEIDTPFFAAAETFLSWALTAEVGNWWDGNVETSGSIVWHVADDPDRLTGEHEETVRTSEFTAWGDDDGDAPTEPTAAAPDHHPEAASREG